MRFRPILAFMLLAAWTVMPALACLPTRNMSMAEMACCKKMAGNCRMSTGQHPCCKTAKSSEEPDAKIERLASHVLPYQVVTLIEVFFEPPRAQDHISANELGLPPPAPPGLNSILRI